MKVSISTHNKCGNGFHYQFVYNYISFVIDQNRLGFAFVRHTNAMVWISILIKNMCCSCSHENLFVGKCIKTWTQFVLVVMCLAVYKNTTITHLQLTIID